MIFLQLLCGRLGIEIARNGNAVASFFAVLPAEILPFRPESQRESIRPPPCRTAMFPLPQNQRSLQVPAFVYISFVCPLFTEKCPFFQYSKGEKRMSTRHEYCKKVLRIAKKKEYPLSERYSFRRLFFLALLADPVEDKLLTFHIKIQIRYKLSCNFCQCVHVQIIHSAADTANRMRMTPHHSIITGA